MPSTKGSGLDLEEAMKAVGDAMWYERQRKGALGARDKGSIKADIRKRHPGLSDEAADFAAEKVLDRAYRFKPPEKGVATTAAKAWVNRGKIALGALAVAGVVAAGAAAVGLQKVAKEASLNRAEARVEESLEAAYSEFTGLRAEIKSLEDTSDTSILPQGKAAEFNFDLTDAGDQLDIVKPFFDAYVRNGVADDLITRENYEQAGQTLESVTPKISRSSSALGSAKKIFADKIKLDDILATLKSANSTVQTSEVPSTFKSRSTMEYDSGAEAVASWNYDKANTHLGAIRAIQGDAKSFGRVAGRVNPLCSSIEAEAKEATVRRQASQTCDSARLAARNANVDQLKGLIANLERTEYTLLQDYEIRRTRARLEGQMKNGVDRWDDSVPIQKRRTKADREQNRHLARWYVFGSAYDTSTGQKLDIWRTNEECITFRPGMCEERRWPKQEKRDVYGERVPLDQLDRVISDIKSGSNSNNTAVIAKKPRGYMTEQFLYPHKRLGQITRW